jgi:hypothetical protein
MLWAALVLAAPALWGGGPDFATVTTDGEFRLDQSTVRGTATLLDSSKGNVVETLSVPSRVQMRDGARIDLAPGTRARIYGNRLVLEKGSGELTMPKAFSVEARSLRISPHESGARASIALHQTKEVRVAALAGHFRVHTAAGILVSNVETGMKVAFEPQVAGQAAPSSLVGCLLKKDNRWILYDLTARITVELRGTGFEPEWGNRVQVNGTARAAAQPAGGTVQVLDVSSVIHIDTGGCADVAKTIAADLPPSLPKPEVASVPPPAASGGGGMSAGTKVAIIGAIAGGAGAAGYVATQQDRSN